MQDITCRYKVEAWGLRRALDEIPSAVRTRRGHSLKKRIQIRNHGTGKLIIFIPAETAVVRRVLRLAVLVVKVGFDGVEGVDVGVQAGCGIQDSSIADHAGGEVGATGD